MTHLDLDSASATRPELIPALRRERGFIPLDAETIASYKTFWSKSSANLKQITQVSQAEYNSWPSEKVYNGWFECGDAELYYAMIRYFKPNQIIEIGSGFSTFFAAEACKVNGKGQITAIDPIPRTDLPDTITFVRDFIQKVDLSLFDRLGENDILFIDSSHEAEEALYHYLILDRLAPGVVVHHHDFLFPLALDEPQKDIVITYAADGSPVFGKPSQIEYPEENVIISYYVNRREHWEGLVSNASACHELGPEGFGKIFHNHKLIPGRIGGSIYTRKLSKATVPAPDHNKLVEEHEKNSRYAEHVTQEYKRLEGRVQELENILGRPSLTARATLKNTLAEVSRRVRGFKK